MDIVKLHQPLLNHDESFGDISIGNSKYQDDVWDLTPLIESKSIRPYQKKINFLYIYSEEMKEVVKAYAYYLLSKNKPQTVRCKIAVQLRAFISYCKDYSIHSFREVTTFIFMDFLKYLKEVKQLAPKTGYHYSWVVEELINIGQIKGWAVPDKNLFVLTNSMKEWGKQIKSERKERKHDSIPDKIFTKILDCAMKDKKGSLTKAGIIIQSQTGLRISEILEIKKGCISTTADGNTYMTVRTPKTEKDDEVIHKVFVNQLVVDAVKELEEHTELLRKESGLDELFLLRKRGEIGVPNAAQFNENRITPFIKKWDIRDEDGELYKLTTHQFRVHFVNDLIKKNVPLTFIMKHFNHVSVEMTDHYSRLNAEIVTQKVKDIVKPDSKIAGLNANTIKRNLSEQFKGKTEQEIDKFVSQLSKSMYINPLPLGVCLQDSRRGGCDNADGCIMINCPNFVTTKEYYPIHKRELDLLEAEMKRYEIDGRVREYQRLKAKWIYLKPIVDSLEEQMNGE